MNLNSRINKPLDSQPKLSFYDLPMEILDLVVMGTSDLCISDSIWNVNKLARLDRTTNRFFSNEKYIERFMTRFKVMYGRSGKEAIMRALKATRSKKESMMDLFEVMKKEHGALISGDFVLNSLNRESVFPKRIDFFIPHFIDITVYQALSGNGIIENGLTEIAYYKMRDIAVTISNHTDKPDIKRNQIQPLCYGRSSVLAVIASVKASTYLEIHINQDLKDLGNSRYGNIDINVYLVPVYKDLDIKTSIHNRYLFDIMSNTFDGEELQVKDIIAISRKECTEVEINPNYYPDHCLSDTDEQRKAIISEYGDRDYKMFSTTGEKIIDEEGEWKRKVKKLWENNRFNLKRNRTSYGNGIN